MKVFAVCSYPLEAAATRFRLTQFVEPLKARGVELSIHPFLDREKFQALYRAGGAVGKGLSLLSPILQRSAQALTIGKFDLLLIQREAMIFGPGFFEWVYQKTGRVPMVLDLDDATYVRYVSPTYGKLGSFFKFFGKTDNLIDRADLVISGNRFIAEYVSSKGGKSVVIPTVVDETIFCPKENRHEVPVLGWIGTHSTYPFLEALFPVLAELAKKHRFKLKVVGSAREEISVPGVDVENLPWSLEREVRDFQELDIGLYPIETAGDLDSRWLLGKSGFKAIQYMAVGVPYVVTPLGVCAEIGVDGTTHFSAALHDDWYACIDRLLSDRDLRTKMGDAGRAYSLRHFSLNAQADLMAESLKKVHAGFPSRRKKDL